MNMIMDLKTSDCFEERIQVIINDFSKVIVPSQESAKFAEKLFVLIGEMQGTIKGLESRVNYLQSAVEGKK